MSDNEQLIRNHENDLVCTISHKDENKTWLVHMLSGTSYIALTLFPDGGYGRMVVPEEELEQDVDLADLDEIIYYEESPVKKSSHKTDKHDFCKFITNIYGESNNTICLLAFNDEDGTWMVEFPTLPYLTMVFMYFNGAYMQAECPKSGLGS